VDARLSVEVAARGRHDTFCGSRHLFVKRRELALVRVAAQTKRGQGTMGLRDLLGVGKRGETKQAVSPVSKGMGRGEVLADDTPMSSGEGVSSGFATPAGMVGDLRGTSSTAPLPRGAIANQPYNPYTGLGGPFDPNMSKALYSLSDSPEFLFDEERGMKRRSWSENLTFLTGVGYLGGTLAGGGMGAYRGIVGPSAGAQSVGNESRRLLLNRVLNTGGAKGAALGNTWGCIGLYYAAIESLAGYYLDQEYPVITAIAAGAGAGSVFKSMQGPRAMAVYGVVGASLSAVNQIGQAVAGR
tara:strand:+ start:1794 stop:2690 length:897 start_codon:yes stop_codon:yes gene_type:complete